MQAFANRTQFASVIEGAVHTCEPLPLVCDSGAAPPRWWCNKEIDLAGSRDGSIWCTRSR